MTRAVVLYHSLFGNTKAVVMSLAKGIEESGIEVECRSIDEVRIERLPDYDFLAIGSPTHKLGPSKPMKEFLKRLRTVNLQEKKALSFDTRAHSRLNSSGCLILENSAARKIEGIMKRMRMEIIKPRQSAIVEGRKGPLEPGAEERFEEIGKEIGRFLSP